jgi:sialic acid synthase SpsE
MHPKYYGEVLGKKFNQAVKKGTPLNNELIG